MKFISVAAGSLTCVLPLTRRFTYFCLGVEEFRLQLASSDSRLPGCVGAYKLAIATPWMTHHLLACAQ